MNADEWKEVEQRLKRLYWPVELDCDGYRVTLVLERLNDMKNCIGVYIDGVIKVKWAMEDCEERRRFLRPVKKYLFTKKQREVMKKVSKKLRQKAGWPDPDKSFIGYSLYWTSFKSLKVHLIKNNNEIKLVSKA